MKSKPLSIDEQMSVDEKFCKYEYEQYIKLALPLMRAATKQEEHTYFDENEFLRLLHKIAEVSISDAQIMIKVEHFRQ